MATTKQLLTSAALKEAANCLRILSHPMRLRIIQILLKRERTVGEIADACAIPHNVASTHLKIMERCRFLDSTRDGKNVTYSIVESHLRDLMRCLEKRFFKET